MEITKQRQRVDAVRYSRSFHWREEPSRGFSFDCDQAGNVDPAAFTTAGAENWRKCVSAEYDVVDEGVRADRWSYVEPAEGRCECGRTVVLHGDTDCECGRIYNGAGQALAPRSAWGEETGESFGDARDW